MDASPHIVLRVERLTKRFGAVVANDQVSFDLRRGEIHCLLGENGAGKSTLAECLCGSYRPESGQIFLDGLPVSFARPGDAIARGIGMIHQHFVLAQPLSALENIAIGERDGVRGRPRLRLDRLAQSLQAWLDRFGLAIDLHAPVWQLPVAQQQWVEILKALHHGARVLILDEPSAVLTPQESARLFQTLRGLGDEGMGIVLVSHKFHEVMQSDRVTVLRKGRSMGTLETRRTTQEEMTRLMIARDLPPAARERRARRGGPAVLSIASLVVRGDRGQRALDGFGLEVSAGEIVGIAGVAGNGQTELFEALVGVRRPVSGSFRVAGEDLTHRGPRAIQQRGVGIIPEDRFADGLVPDFSIAENMVLGQEGDAPFARHGVMRFARMAACGREAIARLGIAAPSEHAITRGLSGGNAQKVIVAREMARAGVLLLANQPSRGLDVGVTHAIHQQLRARRDDGLAVLLASEEIDELMALCDRIAVIFKGRIVGLFDVQDASAERIGRLMAGDESRAEEACA